MEGHAKEYAETKAIEIALNLTAGGILSSEQIAAATGLSVDEVKNLQPQKL